MRNISRVVYYAKDDPARWYKINWIIVSTSHAIYKTHGARGHKVRQKIRHRFWDIAQRKYPILNRYSNSYEVSGDSKCKIQWYYRIWISFHFKKDVEIRYSSDSEKQTAAIMNFENYHKILSVIRIIIIKT